MSAGLPVALVVGTSALSPRAAGITEPIIGLVLSEVSIGAGQAYAGDWRRAGFVGLGGIGIGLVAVSSPYFLQAFNGGNLGNVMLEWEIGAALNVAYAVWSGFDAYRAAERATGAVPGSSGACLPASDETIGIREGSLTP